VEPDESPVVVIDSSLGGLSIVAALRERLPHEPIAFFADIARAPYAQRSPESVVKFVQQVVHYTKHLSPKHIVLACEVASAVALAAARQQADGATVTGVLDPGARAVVELTGEADKPTIGALASNMVIESRALERAIIRRRTRAKLVCRPAPLLQAIVEDGRSHGDPLLLLAAEQCLDQLLPRGVEVILLASTALSPARRQLSALAGEEVRVVDASRACADDVVRRLKRSRLIHPKHTSEPAFRWFLTDESPEMFDRAERIAGFLLPPPRIVALEELEAMEPAQLMHLTG
jgi:glutamate racemase